MTPGRRPWWVDVVAASFLVLTLFNGYLVIWGPELADGLDATFDGGALHVRSVAFETPFARAGLQSGDQLLAVNDLPMLGPREWRAALANVRAGQPETWHVLRNGSRLELAVTFDTAKWTDRLTAGLVAYLAGILGFLLLGLFIGVRRPHDPAARIGAWLFLSTSAAFGLLNGWAALWRQTPAFVQALLWIPEVSRFVAEAIGVSFFAMFPRPLFRKRWIWFAIWIPVLATLPWRLSWFYSVIYQYGHVPPVPGWFNRAIFIRAILYAAVTLVFLTVSYRWRADANERRRIRVLMLGMAISLVAGGYASWVFSFEEYRVQSVASERLIPLVALIGPVAFGYAIVRHRVLDIHLIVRQGLQYALARRAVLAIVPALAAILAVDIAVHSHEPLAGILRARGWIYAGVGALGLVAVFQRTQWLAAIDRRFFREQYNSLRVLREVIDEIQQSRSIDEVAARVVARIETALHPEFVAVMVREATGREYRCFASVPGGQACPPIDVDSKLVALLGVLGKPLEVLPADSGWLQARLPEPEISFVRDSRLDLLVPIRTMTSERIEAFLALGTKRSEEPFTQEDQDLLEAIASSLARLLERPVTAIRPPPNFGECPRCGTCYDAHTGTCPIEGAVLTPVGFSRTLAGRYWLEQCRGLGGMGRVYAAMDTALRRRVAVKVILDHLVGTEVARRFPVEAQAAATFAHPNVVTVHDYGIEAGNRPFLVMELLEGVTLRDELKRCARLDSSRTLAILRGVCLAVEAAHRRQLIHRDLKPENIFLARTPDEPGETVKVLDFGLSKFLSARHDEARASATAQTTNVGVETTAGMLVGTFDYMSPEQMRGEHPAVSWDLWAIAVVAYEALTGALPFPKHSSDDWRPAVVYSFAPLAEHVPYLSERAQALFADSFAVARATRAPTAAEFFQRLQDALAVEGQAFTSRSG
jgi:tRNA A-37 threonylcarbamoyl transferase component Bud32